MKNGANWSVVAEQGARRLAECLGKRGSERIVFAESCTCGMVVALLGQVPGISNWLCGSAVTYRESVKQQWIGVSSKTLHEKTAESTETTQEMAIGVLERTPEASFSAAVSGHLGPGAPMEVDGQVFVAVATRIEKPVILAAETFHLIAAHRTDRQYEASNCVFKLVVRNLS